MGSPKTTSFQQIADAPPTYDEVTRQEGLSTGNEGQNIHGVYASPAHMPGVVQTPRRTDPPIIQQPVAAFPAGHANAAYDYGQPPPIGAGPPLPGQPAQGITVVDATYLGRNYPHVFYHSGQQWMALPEAVGGCPPGLEYLTMIDQLLCKQKFEIIEAFTSWESSNKYVIYNSMGQQVYYAFEDSDMCLRQVCGSQRGFVIHIVDNNNQEVMRVDRPFKFCGGVSCMADVDEMFAHELTIEAPPGNPIARVKQTSSLVNFEYAIFDANKQPKLAITGPCCCLLGIHCIEHDFSVTTTTGESVGSIQRQFSGLIKELYTDADNFGVTFPMNMDVNLKAALLGATFLIDFMAFENNTKQGHNAW